MNIWVRTTVFSVAAVAAASALAQETRLAGIRLYDSGVDVVNKLGSPNDVMAINVTFANAGQGGGSAGGGGGSGAEPAAATFGGGGGPRPMGGPGGGGSTAATETTFVRWVYRRGSGGSVNVVLNNHNKVVQIEAIGVSNANVRTSKGVTLGSSMATVMKLYQTPDSYEVGGNYFMVRFLNKHRVAFRLTRENAQQPYRVTGIVVSAGKQ